jgi:hypothetical protein
MKTVKKKPPAAFFNFFKKIPEMFRFLKPGLIFAPRFEGE